MSPFRLLHVGIAVLLLLIGAPWVVPMADAPEPRAAVPGSQASGWWLGGPALAGVLEPGDSEDNDNEDNDNDDGGADNDNGDDADDGDDFNDNDVDDLFTPASPPAPSRPPEPACSTPGQEATFWSHDQKLSVRVFPSMPRPVRIEVYQVIDFLEAPLPPGTPVGLLAYEIRASFCDLNPLHELPAEVNVGIRYGDLEATGLDESRFVIGWLDVPAATWVPVEKQANDPSSNDVSATTTLTGYYMVWESR